MDAPRLGRAAAPLQVDAERQGEIVFLDRDGFGQSLVPGGRHAKIEMASVTWNYTTVLNIVFLLVAAMLLWRYFRRGGGWHMLRMMNKPMDHDHHHSHQHDGAEAA